jgi:hypothetical protein
MPITYEGTYGGRDVPNVTHFQPSCRKTRHVENPLRSMEVSGTEMGLKRDT